MSATATTDGGRRSRRVPGEPGIWVFVLGDMTVFTILFGAIIITRNEEPAMFRAGQDALSLPLGLLNTVLLLYSSLLVALAVHQTRRGAARRALRSLAGVIALGAGFVVVKGFEWGGHFADGVTVRTDRFFDQYFIFTGLHLVHVLIGIAVLSWLALRQRRAGAAAVAVRNLESGAVYWHMVDLLWIVLFSLYYVAG